MKRMLLVFALIGIISASCRKENRNAKNLEGRWIVIEQTENGYSTLNNEIYYEFAACERAYTSICYGTLEIITDTSTTSYSVEIKHEGNAFYFDNSGLTPQGTVKYEIEELSDFKLILSTTFGTVILMRI